VVVASFAQAQAWMKSIVSHELVADLAAHAAADAADVVAETTILDEESPQAVQPSASDSECSKDFSSPETIPQNLANKSYQANQKEGAIGSLFSFKL
jgi:hypothetical protein